ncbi:ribosomal protein L7Ae-like protein [Clostridium sulfidigenes]|uniref:Ribosomal protein L7Ae-like protein n=1 Tax=Clostridium sulfidigenes TaxID=318464 RepID=A0A084J8A0_9CLOT|nr:ribosomal L7Ae/L30e/S12e/Gadd45 family protein [Clostridium sulfidigenes]KEZ85184.1 ribosomal protein L7Ae-like protein [Clostridium sulfidigenes]HBA04766.1 50S ribosomal protein L7ae-like protein [Clostridium sp.]HCO74468.1 50S ribosomal protein L7ae-like protein [Clostridium sp.]
MVTRLVGEKVVGVKQTAKALKNNLGCKLYVAKDADSKLLEPILKLAVDRSLEIVEIDTMKELGVLCGIDVSAATALII